MRNPRFAGFNQKLGFTFAFELQHYDKFKHNDVFKSPVNAIFIYYCILEYNQSLLFKSIKLSLYFGFFIANKDGVKIKVNIVANNNPPITV